MVKIPHDRLTELFASHQGSLERFLTRRLDDPDAARDVAQEAFERLMRFEKGDQIESPEAYLFSIAANLISDYWAARSRKVPLTDEPVELDSLASDMRPPDEQVEGQQSIQALRKALELLPEIQRNVLLLHRQEGCTYDEIGERLGISRDMVKKYLAKALVRCRGYLSLTVG